MNIVLGDLDDPRIRDLLAFHVLTARAESPPCSVHALDADGLRAPGVEFWSAWDGDTLLGFAALKRLAPDHGEIKSMHVVHTRRRSGTGSALLTHLFGRARQMGLDRVSLETGRRDYFLPAQALYRKHGFVDCAPFGDYRPDRNSVFMTLELTHLQPKDAE